MLSSIANFQSALLQPYIFPWYGMFKTMAIEYSVLCFWCYFLIFRFILLLHAVPRFVSCSTVQVPELCYKKHFCWCEQKCYANNVLWRGQTVKHCVWLANLKHLTSKFETFDKQRNIDRFARVLLSFFRRICIIRQNQPSSVRVNLTIRLIDKRITSSSFLLGSLHSCSEGLDKIGNGSFSAWCLW